MHLNNTVPTISLPIYMALLSKEILLIKASYFDHMPWLQSDAHSAVESWLGTISYDTLSL